MEATVNKQNPALNRVHAEDSAAHNWYRFVLSFPPHLVREYLGRFQAGTGSAVLDPFCGTGTTLVECKKLGIHAIGLESNPMAAFSSGVKTTWDLDADQFITHAREMAERVKARLVEEGTPEHDLPLFVPASESSAPMRSLAPEAMALLLKDSISALPLHKTLCLLEAIDEHADQRYRNHYRLALANALVSGISNLRFGPEVGVGKRKVDAPVLDLWLAKIGRMATDLMALRPLDRSPVTVDRGDARFPSKTLGRESIDLVITSPPYPNEKDYTRTTRLESVILGFINNKQELRQLKQGLLRSNTRGVYKSDTDDALIAGHTEIARIAEEIEARRIELGKTSGFERMYARVTKLYFGGMARHLADLRTVLRPGARLAYVVGDQASYLRVMIRTGQLLGSIAESLGFEVVDIDLFRTRAATATGEQLREEVLVLRWSG